MKDRPITWADLEPRRPANSYELTGCPKCGHVVARRLPEGSYHRNVADARAGVGRLTRCPQCNALLQHRNPAN